MATRRLPLGSETACWKNGNIIIINACRDVSQGMGMGWEWE